MEGKRVQLLLRAPSKQGPGRLLGGLTGTVLTERPSLHFRSETERGVFVKLDRGGWIELEITDRTEQPAGWDEDFIDGLGPVERHSAA